jgi:hypothetical protein
MSLNKFKPHLYVLPEDDANRQIANGFVIHCDDSSQIRVLRSMGGWTKACQTFATEYVTLMKNYNNTHVVLLVDFDSRDDRLEQVQETIPLELRDRVFVLGARSVPEELRRAGMGNFEEIGEKLAEDCRTGSRGTWDHEFLKHNHSELDRMLPILRPILFHE